MLTIKIPANLVTATLRNTKITEIGNKIPDVSDLVTTTVLNTKIREVENKIPHVSGLVKKTDNNTKILDIKAKQLKYTSKLFHTKIKKRLVDKFNISNLVKKSDIDTKLATLTTKVELKAEQDKILKLQVFDSKYFCSKSHFEVNGTQNYLVFQAVYRYFNTVANSNKVIRWKSKELPNENVKPPSLSDNSLNPVIISVDIVKM